MFWFPELFTQKNWDFPSGPVIKTLPSNAVGMGSNSSKVQELFPPVFWPENQNIKQKQYYNKFGKDFIKWSTSCPLKKERMWQIVSIYMTNPKT